MNYRKFLLVLCSLLWVSGAVAQEKLFKEAISKGPGTDGFYTIHNSSPKYSVEDFRVVAANNGYLLDPSIETKRVSRFGDVTTQVVTVRFIPRSEHLAYIYYVLSRKLDSTPADFNSLSQGGDAMLFFDKSTQKNRKYFWPASNVYWSAGRDKGQILGTGTGFCISDEYYIAFQGKFHKGYPVGKATFAWLPKSAVVVTCNENKVIIMLSNVGSFHDDMAWFNIEGKYGFIDALTRSLIEPQFSNVIKDFKDIPSETNYAVVLNPKDKKEWKMNRFGVLFALSDYEQKKIDDANAAAEKARQEAAKKAAEERRIAEAKAAEERRIAEEQEREYQARVKANSNPAKWEIGDRLCMRMEGRYLVSGTLEEWAPSKKKVKIKIITSPGARTTYLGQRLEKNTTIWINVPADGWHKSWPEEISLAERMDNSAKTISQEVVVICPSCSGKGWRGSNKCYKCDGVGFIMETKTTVL